MQTLTAATKNAQDMSQMDDKLARLDAIAQEAYRLNERLRSLSIKLSGPRPVAVPQGRGETNVNAQASNHMSRFDAALQSLITTLSDLADNMVALERDI